jgi:nicotinamide riboside transporter PnuC
MLLSFLFDRGLCIMPKMFACYMIVMIIGALSIVKPHLLVIYTHTIYWPKYTLLITKYNKEINIECWCVNQWINNYYIIFITDIIYVFIFQCSIHTYEECQLSNNTDRTYQRQNIQSKGTVLV